MTDLQFNPEIAKRFGATCPPPEAAPVDQVIYRGIPNPPVSDRDFLSHVEANLHKNDPNKCDHWGLSVWVSLQDVEHARKAYRWAKFWHIAEGKVTADDGVLLATPSTPQPNHHTFWKCFGRNITQAFNIILNPVNR